MAAFQDSGSVIVVRIGDSSRPAPGTPGVALPVYLDEFNPGLPPAEPFPIPIHSGDVRVDVQSAIAMNNVCEPYVRRRAIRHMEKGRVVIFAAGTGNPFFTTDTAAALRASEMGCDALLKGTQVDGVYTADPKKVKDAKRYERLGYQEVLAKDLRVMDASAISLARDNRIPILVFSIHAPGAFAEVVAGRGHYTIITEEA